MCIQSGTVSESEHVTLQIQHIHPCSVKNNGVTGGIWAFPGLMIPQSIFPVVLLLCLFLGLGEKKHRADPSANWWSLSISFPRMLIKDNKPSRSFLCCSKLTVTSAPLAQHMHMARWGERQVHAYTHTHTHTHAHAHAHEAAGEYIIKCRR